jgi:hypothetical protein
MNWKEFCVKIEIKTKFGTTHKNIIKVLHPSLGPPNGFINPMNHPWVQKQILNMIRGMHNIDENRQINHN